MAKASVPIPSIRGSAEILTQRGPAILNKVEFPCFIVRASRALANAAAAWVAVWERDRHNEDG